MKNIVFAFLLTLLIFAVIITAMYLFYLYPKEFYIMLVCLVFAVAFVLLFMGILHSLKNRKTGTHSRTGKIRSAKRRFLK